MSSMFSFLEKNVPALPVVLPRRKYMIIVFKRLEELSNKVYSLEEIARLKVLQRKEGRINSYVKIDNDKGLQSMKTKKYGSI